MAFGVFLIFPYPLTEIRRPDKKKKYRNEIVKREMLAPREDDDEISTQIKGGILFYFFFLSLISIYLGLTFLLLLWLFCSEELFFTFYFIPHFLFSIKIFLKKSKKFFFSIKKMGKKNVHTQRAHNKRTTKTL